MTMREKQERFVVTFATTTGAMAMERACRTLVNLARLWGE